MEEKTYYSISEINEYIKILFDNTSTLKNIYLKGEISNFKGANRSGHLYFTLKDAKSSLSAVMFKYDSFSLTFEPKNGDEVIVLGSISSYAPSGTYQIICKKIQLFGVGEQLLKREQLKKKLFAEGIFDPNHKLEIPKFPKKIAIITGKNSAAARDFVFNIERRYPLCKTELFYSLVQGEEAPKDLINNLHKAIEYSPDLIIIGRGGGASEDLNAFDDETLVREIYNCKIPLISAVGHEINSTLCDLVADKHASTPTGAAEYAVPDINDIENDLKQIDSFILSLINAKISQYEKEIKSINESKYFANVYNLFNSYLQKLKFFDDMITNSFKNTIDDYEKKIYYFADILDSLNPKNLIEKGYSIIYKDGHALNDISQFKEGDEISISINGGLVKAIVKETKANE